METTRTTVKERSTGKLHDLTIAPDRYAGVKTDRYSGADTDRYASANADRYAEPTEDRYAVAERNLRYARQANHTADPARDTRYAADRDKRYTQKRRLIRRTVTIVTPPRGTGRLVWLPALELERCYEFCQPMGLCERDMVVDFSEAAEASYYNDFVCDPDDAWMVGLVANDIADTYQDVIAEWMEPLSPLWPELCDRLAELRREIVANPVDLAVALGVDDMWAIQRWAGEELVPTEDEILLAIADDPTGGLGGAALDYAVWCIPNMFGASGVRVAEMFEDITRQEYVYGLPQDNFVLYSDDLYPDTVYRTHGSGLYELYGEFAIWKIAYRSNPECTGVGWRTCYLAPTGTASKPMFEPFEY